MNTKLSRTKFLFSCLGAISIVLFFQNCGEGSFRARKSQIINLSSSNEASGPNFQDGINESLEIPQNSNASELDAARAAGTLYYVAINGNDNNDGKLLPFRTIQKFVNIARPGDTVLVRRGRYAPVDFRNKNGLAGRPITLLGEPGAVVDRNLSTDPERKRVIEFWGGSYITISGLELTDSDPTLDNLPTAVCGTPQTSHSRLSSQNAIKLNNSSQDASGVIPNNIIFKNLHIHHVAGQAILGTANDSQFLNNHVHHAGINRQNRIQAYGMYVKGKRWLIRGNRIHDNNGHGIRTGNYFPDDQIPNLLIDSVIENNLIYNNGSRVLHSSGPTGCRVVDAGDGIIVYHGSGNIIRNNVIFGSYNSGIKITSNYFFNQTPNQVYNNTLYNNEHHGIQCKKSSVDIKTVLINNISFGNLLSAIDRNCANPLSRNNLTTDPKFVNVNIMDFRLQANSPAIDRGASLTSEVPTDFRGILRPRGNGYDIGAYEY